ncbi:MAG: molecular chaperone [Lachnospira sp.]|nr:molecular chaperone [Lachnospira sp.]
MEDLRTQQIEALQVAAPYCEKMIGALKSMIEEFSGNRQEDTDEYMKGVVDGLNWIFEVYNGTSSLINEGGEVINKDEVNGCVAKLSAAADDTAKAEAFKGILEFVVKFKTEADKYVSGEDAN